MSAAAPAAGATAPVGTPRADAALHNPLLAPAGVADWLRRCEAALVGARVRADAAVDAARSRGEEPNPRLARAAAELARALDDPRIGGLPRLLRRPLWQLAPGEPAREVFARLAERMVARGDDAVQLQAHVARAHAEFRSVCDAWGARFPSLLARALDAAGVSAREFEHVRRPQDADALAGRVAGVAERMRAWDAELADDPSGAEVEVVEGETLTAAELAALTRRGLRERERRLVSAARSDDVRRRLARHAADARAAAPTAATSDPLADDPRAPIARELLLTAARLGDPNALGADDAPLWAWALDGAAPGRAPAWSAGDLADVAHGDGGPAAATARATLYVVPLDTDVSLGTGTAGDGPDDCLAVITPTVPSPVRVWNARVQPGAPIEGQIVAPASAGAAVERDLALLYDGVDAGASAWYRTARRPHLRVVARRGQTWIARVEERGHVQRTTVAPWDDDPAATAGTFRALRPAPAHPARATAPEVDVLGDAGESFLGCATVEVRTGYAGDGRAWLRTPARDDGSGRAGSAATLLDRELALFTELAARGPRGLALAPIGFGRRTSRGEPWPLYRRPLATGPGLGVLAPAWLHDVSGRLALVAAIARTLVGVHAAGAAVGVVHPAAFAYALAYALAYGRENAGLAPRAVLAYAPCATPLGLRFDGASARAIAAAGPLLWLPRLRMPAVPAAVSEGAVATRGVDGAGFLRCLLDLLTLDSLPSSVLLEDGAVGEQVRSHRAHFAAPGLATNAAALLDGGEAEAMVRVLESIAAHGIARS